jgi:cysteinyl-tRNA synthetase
VKDEIPDSTFSSLNFAPAQNSIDNAFQQSLVNNLGVNAVAQIQDDFNYPANVAVLKQLIAKLPTGVSKQTGALIIKQTMEALGISMSSVLQEARQVQETFANNARECQTNIVEYRKQITVLEAKAQQYQKQYAVMNDIINLFLQTGKM